MNWLMTICSDANLTISFISLIVGILSVVISTFLTVTIFRYQKKQDKRLSNLQNELKQKEIEEKAKRFIIENNNELQYLSFCVFAYNIRSLKKHKRKIYTEYCLCSPEVQKEILYLNNICTELPNNDKWLDAALECLKKDIVIHEFGRNVLYDGAKLFHKGVELYGNDVWTNSDSQCIFNPIGRDLVFFSEQPKNFIGYIEEYMYFKYSEYKPTFFNTNPLAPIDYVWEKESLASAEEYKACAWVMEIVYAVSQTVIFNKYIEKENVSNMIKESDVIIETFEDKYYQAVQALYNAYYSKSYHQ